MSEAPEKPFIGPPEQSLFEIADTRERADELRKRLTPKLIALLDWARDLIVEVYGEDSLDPYRIVVTPANRKKAKSTRGYEEVSAGFAVKKQGDQYHHWYFQQRIECTQEGLSARIFGHRGGEATPLVSVLQRHRSEAASLLDHLGSYLFQKGLYADELDEGQDADQYDPLVSIGRLRTGSDRDRSVGITIKGLDEAVPVPDENSAWPVVYNFVAMFPIFRAATDIRLGREDRFPTYLKQFWDWDATLEDESDGSEEAPATAIDTASVEPPEADAFAMEGERKLALRQHFTRERGLKKRKIRDALRSGDGHLRCEVPGCGFDFFAVYGEIGKRYAHVHHLTPLGAPVGPRMTRLGDLAIVCANCHSMIHQGNQCRPLEGLIPSRD